MSIHCYRQLLVLALLLAVFGCSCNETVKVHRPTRQGRPVPAFMGVDVNSQVRVAAGDRCPVCSMPVVQSVRLAATVELKDGWAYNFDSANCALRAWLHPELFLAVPRDQRKQAIFTGYISGKSVAGSRAIFVAGSDISAATGPAIVPLLGDKQVKALRQRHGGNTTFRLNELNDALWQNLTGGPAIPMNP